MNDEVQTWHHGLMARHWAENNTTGPEIAYYQRQIEQYGQPALDTGCGTGRLLLPYLRAGLDVDGVDVSGDMLAYCRQTAESEGLSPRLYQQALHALDLPRRYRLPESAFQARLERVTAIRLRSRHMLFSASSLCSIASSNS